MSNYKCPNCGAPIVFKPEIAGFKCDYCFSTFSEVELTESLKASEKYVQEDAYKSAETVLGYECKNCGAKVVLGETSNTAYCYYCHSPVVVSSRLKNEFKPDIIIPFKIEKKLAIRRFLEWAKQKKFTPNNFSSEMQKEKMAGVYLPFWLVDFDANVDYSAIGIVKKSWVSGNTNYIKTQKYEIKRSGTVKINDMLEVAFSKINKKLIDAISDYDISQKIVFSPGYLAGFFSERYNRLKEECETVLKKQAKEKVRHQIKNSYNVTEIQNEQDNTKLKTKSILYALLPVWILSYVYKGKVYIFAVNGQTGKVAGETPISTVKMALTSFVIAIAIASLFILGGLFIW